MKGSSLFSVLFREAFSNPYISFFQLLVNGFCVTGFRTFFRRPLTLLILVGGEEVKWHQLAHHQLMSQQGPHFSQYSTAKTMLKAHSSGITVSSGISDVVIASVYSEKPD